MSAAAGVVICVVINGAYFYRMDMPLIHQKNIFSEPVEPNGEASKEEMRTAKKCLAQALTVVLGNIILSM